MFPAQMPGINPGKFSRSEERRQMTVDGKNPGLIQKMDAALKENIYHALWKDDVLRAMEDDEIDVHIKNGVVYLKGHIVGASSRSRIENAIRAIPGIEGIRNNLILDDELTLEVAASLGILERTHGCKFFTGVSHGVVSLNGMVNDENVKLLAEKCAADNPNVRAVINHVRVSGVKLELQDQPFLQPTIGENIYFLDGISGVVKQVIIDPNNRRVIAMTVQGKFTRQQTQLNSLAEDQTRLPEQLIVLRMSVVRYLTKVSGFLNIQSYEREQFVDFDPGNFIVPDQDWVPPFPYCPDDILFPAENQNADIQIAFESQRLPFTPISKDSLLGEQLLANDSLGG